VSCQQVRELFTARADDALGDDERARLDAHLATCADCAREWEGFERTVGLLRAVAPARAPAGFVDRVLAARPRPWYDRLVRGLLVPWPVKLPVEAAAIVLVAGLAALVFQRSPDLQQAARAPAPPPGVTAPVPSSPQPGATAPSGRTLDGPQAPIEEREARSRAAPPPATMPPPLVAQSPEPSRPGKTSRAPEASSATASRDAAPSPRAAESSPKSEARSKNAEGDIPAMKDAAGERAVARQVAPAAPRTLQKAAEVQRLAAALDVQARLAVAEPVAAERTVHDLVTRAGGRVLSRVEDEGAIVLGLSVPGDRWDELQRGLQALGTLRLDGRSPDPAGPVRIGLRLER
jgi:Putative zinc-finger